MHRPLRLTIDRTAIQANWRWLAGPRRRCPPARRSRPTATALARARRRTRCYEAGCRDFFVSTWAEAEALGAAAGRGEPRRPPRRRTGRRGRGAELRSRGRASTRRAGRALEGDRAGPPVRRDDRYGHEPPRPAPDGDRRSSTASTIDTLHSHLACADEDSAMNAMQLERFRDSRRGGAGEALQPRQ